MEEKNELIEIGDSALISVIVPFYNSERFIKTFVDDFSKQTYKNFECLLIDDGSTDNGGNIAKEECEKDCRFKYYRLEHNGVSAARNYGLDICKGDYVCFSDIDDINDKRRLETCMHFLKEHKTENIVFTEYKQTKTKTPTIKHGFYNLDNYYRGQDSKIYCVWHCLIKKNFIGDIKFRDTPLGEDTLFINELIFKQGNFYVLDYVGYLYVERDDSSFKKILHSDWSESQQECFLDAISEFLDCYKNSVKEIKSLIYRILNANLQYRRPIFVNKSKIDSIIKKTQDIFYINEYNNKIYPIRRNINSNPRIRIKQ